MSIIIKDLNRNLCQNIKTLGYPLLSKTEHYMNKNTKYSTIGITLYGSTHDLKLHYVIHHDVSHLINTNTHEINLPVQKRCALLA